MVGPVAPPEPTAEPGPAAPAFVLEPVAEASTNEPTPEEPAAEPTPRRFSVHLACRIPIGENPLVVEAADEQAAWREFCRVKQIGETDGGITIKEIHEPEPAGTA